MNLLDSVLCTSNAEEYSENFKQHGVDAFTLKLLDNEDLKLLGITEKEKRESILQHASNLQIPAEKQITRDVDFKYIQLILANMSLQLTKHLAAISIAVNRPDTIICNIKLADAASCMRGCVLSLDKQLNEFEEKAWVTVQTVRHNNSKKIVISAVAVASFLLISVSYKMCRLFVCK